MKARDIFGLIVRCAGFFILLWAIWYFVCAASMILQLMTKPGTGHEEYLIWYFTFAVPAFVLGILFLRFGRQIARICYPDDKDDSEP